MAKTNDSIPNDVARLQGVRFVSAVETDDGRKPAESTLKQLTGDKNISAPFMRGEWFDFQPVCKLWLAPNHKPQVRGTDDGIWRRIRLIPFTVSIPPAEQDHDLYEKLLEELPGILNWPLSSFLTKRYNRVFSGGLWSALRMQSKHEECRRKALFPPSLKWPVERLHNDVVSFRQKTTQRPMSFNTTSVGSDNNWETSIESFLQGEIRPR